MVESWGMASTARQLLASNEFAFTAPQLDGIRHSQQKTLNTQRADFLPVRRQVVQHGGGEFAIAANQSGVVVMPYRSLGWVANPPTRYRGWYRPHVPATRRWRDVKESGTYKLEAR